MAPPKSGKTKAQRDKEYRERLKSEGKCIKCRGPNDQLDPITKQGPLRCSVCGDDNKKKLKDKRVEAKTNGLCTTCREKSADTGSLCVTCKERQIDRRDHNKENGLCIDCGKPADLSRCLECILKQEHTYLERIKNKLCGRCGKEPHNDGSTYCNTCLIYGKEYQSQRRINLKMENLCTQCGQEQPIDDRFICLSCYLINNEKWGNKVKSEKCSKCPNIKENKANSICNECKEKLRLEYEKCKELGICVDCGAEPLNTALVCFVCWLKGMAFTHLGSRKKYKELEVLLDKQQYKCVYTKKLLTPGLDASIDHRIPKSRGGPINDINNLQWTYRPINAIKGNLTHDEFLQQLPNLITLLSTITDTTLSNQNINEKDLATGHFPLHPTK